jgi:hypothetical protein
MISRFHSRRPFMISWCDRVPKMRLRTQSRTKYYSSYLNIIFYIMETAIFLTKALNCLWFFWRVLYGCTEVKLQYKLNSLCTIRQCKSPGSYCILWRPSGVCTVLRLYYWLPWLAATSGISTHLEQRVYAVTNKWKYSNSSWTWKWCNESFSVNSPKLNNTSRYLSENIINSFKALTNFKEIIVATTLPTTSGN